MRTTVTDMSSLVAVRYWGENVFPGVVTPALTFITDKSYCDATRLEAVDGVSSERTIKCGDAWIPVSPHQDLIEKLTELSSPLESCFADPGVHTGNCSKKLILPLSEAPPDAVPVLEGKQVARYFCRRPAKALRLGYKKREKEYFTIRPVERYQNAQFVIRQTASYPIVGPRKHADYFRNSLLALYPPDDDRDVRFVVAILNSSLMRYVYSVLIRESAQRAFPQVKVRSLRSLPIRALDKGSAEDKQIHDQLVNSVDKLIDLTANMEAKKWIMIGAYLVAVLMRWIARWIIWLCVCIAYQKARFLK